MCGYNVCTSLSCSYNLSPLFLFLIISALFINSRVQSTTCFKPDTVNKTVTRERAGGREGGREREREPAKITDT